MPTEPWQDHEHFIQEQLGLDSTPASGARWHAPGDAVDDRHPTQHAFRLIADCKFTEHSSKSVKLKELTDWEEKAAEMGRRFIMPLRFWPRGDLGPHDYILLGLADFTELLELVPDTAVHPPEPLLSDEERELLNAIAEQVHPAAPRMAFLNLIDKLRKATK